MDGLEAIRKKLAEARRRVAEVYLLNDSYPRPPRHLFCSRPLANDDGSKTRTRLSPRAQTFSPTASPTALGQSSALTVRKTNHEPVRLR